MIFKKISNLISPKEPLKFDWKFYINNYLDLQNSDISTEEEALLHWNSFGKFEGRICNPNTKLQNRDFKQENAVLKLLEAFKNDDKLDEKIITNSKIVSCLINPKPRGAVLCVMDSKNTLYSLDLYNRLKDVDWFITNEFLEPEKKIKGTYVFAGYLFDHYGHFLIESLTRLWYIKKHPQLPLLWISTTNTKELNTFQAEILSLFDIQNKILIIYEPCIVEKLILPKPGFVIHSYFNLEHSKSLILPQFPIENKDLKKIWLSRSNLSTTNSLSIVSNEKELEDILSSKGWIIFHPENHTVKEQISIMASSKELAGFYGSAFHTLLFLDNIKAKITIFNKNDKYNEKTIIDSTYLLIAKTKKMMQSEIKVSLTNIENNLYKLNDPMEIVNLLEDTTLHDSSKEFSIEEENKIPDFDWNFYINNYKDLQNARINTEEKAIKHWIEYGKKGGRIGKDELGFKTNSKKDSHPNKINIIYFAYLVEEKWPNIVKSQLEKLNELKELIKMSTVYVNLSGNENEIAKASTYIGTNFPSVKIYSTDTKNRFEYIGINCLWEIANNEPDSYCLYFHTKGITHEEEAIYRDILFEKVIAPYEKIKHLFDTNNSINKIGLFSQDSFTWFNFFWVRASYARQCEKPKVSLDRYYYESWLATGPPSQCYQLYFEGQHSYTQDPCKYMREIVPLEKQ